MDRNRLIQRLSTTFALGVALQAIVYLAVAWAYRFLGNLLVDSSARASQGQSAPAAEGIAAVVILLLDLFLALLVGFFGARRLYVALAKAAPKAQRPPVQPVPLAALCAGGIVAAASILIFAASSVALRNAWLGWTLELLRDAAVVGLFWYAAQRSLHPSLHR